MNIVYVLVPLALMIAGGFTVAFLWAAGNGQFDDLDTPAHRVLLEDSEGAGKPAPSRRLSGRKEA